MKKISKSKRKSKVQKNKLQEQQLRKELSKFKKKGYAVPVNIERSTFGDITFVKLTYSKENISAAYDDFGAISIPYWQKSENDCALVLWEGNFNEIVNE